MTFLALLIAAGALALLASRTSTSEEPAETQVRGASGLVWGVRILLHEDGNRLVEVWNRDGRTGVDPGPVIRYVQQGGDRNERYLASLGETASAGLVRSAMADFGVKGPLAAPDRLPPNPSPMVPEGKIRIDPGSYQANVTIPFPASIIATAGLLRDGISKKGFTNVRVSTERPAKWFTSQDADYYVSAVWAEAPELFDKPKALSSFRKVS